MSTTANNNFEIEKNSYVAFDALSLRQLIIERLNKQGTFTDQNFVGSNLASIIDIISYAYHTLIYYLNKTSSESMFSEAQLYENVNRIVKLIDYSPIGFQTSTLSFNCSAVPGQSTGGAIPQGFHTIPRYSFVTVNNIVYSFNTDITFVKTTDDIESLNEIAEQNFLYQGYYQEYPTYTAAGDDNETVIMDVGDELVDHFNIDVYVKPKLSEKWEQYTQTQNLFLETGFDKKYELRLNPNKRYEVKFGNDINGVKLQTGDQVAIYYLASLGNQGLVGPGALGLTNVTKNRYNTIRFNEIINDLFGTQLNLLTTPQLQNIVFNNTDSSTLIKEAETVEDIRRTAPANYRSQNRLVTTRDYEVFIKTNFTNILADVKVVNNWQYIAGYLKYFYDIGLTDPTKTERALFNQVQYADACNFNNIYVLVVPRSSSNNFNYLIPAQKEFIISSVAGNKMATAETVFVDPVYKAVSLGISSNLTETDPEVEEDVVILEVVKLISSRRSNDSIIADIVNIFRTYFDRTNLRLGQTIDTRNLTQQILGVEGVQTFFTTRTDDPSIRTEGLSLFFWNPLYPTRDKMFTINNIPLKYFEYPFFSNINTLANKIKVTVGPTPLEITEY